MEAAPDDPEAIAAAVNTISRMSREEPVAAYLDWWLVVTTGESSPQGLAFHLPDEIPHLVRSAMENLAARAHDGLPVPVAQWAAAHRRLGPLVAVADDHLVLDNYGKSKLPGERDAWAFLVSQIQPTVESLKNGSRSVPFEFDQRAFEKELTRCNIDENSRRWNEMLKRASDCVERINRIVAVENVVQPWIRRPDPPVIDQVPEDVSRTLGGLETILLGPLQPADGDDGVEQMASTQQVADSLESIASGLDVGGLTWLAGVTDRWLEATGANAPTVRAAVLRRNEVVRRIDALRAAGQDADEAELLLLDHDVAGAEQALASLEERRRQDRRSEALTAKLERFRSIGNDGNIVPERWNVRMDEAARLLDSGDLAAAGPLIQQLDDDLRTTRRNDAIEAFEKVRSDLKHFGAPASLLEELDAHLRDLAAHPDQMVDATLTQRSRERLDSLASQRRKELEERLAGAHHLLEVESELIPDDIRDDFEVALSAAEDALSRDEIMAASTRLQALLADIEAHRVHRWTLEEGESALVDHVISYCTQQLHFEPDDVRRLYVAAKTKPFVILAGLTGSGKSTIARLFAAALGANANNGRFRRIAVRPDWIDQSEVLGAVNPLSNRFEPGWLAEVARQCERNLDQLHVVLLDEMNLAPVEQYLAEYLSAIEEVRSGAETTRVPLYSEGSLPTNSDEWPPSLQFPQNLIVIGTVNVDETTRVLSERVLDRANVLQLSVAISDAHHRTHAAAVSPWFVPFSEWDAVCVREPDGTHHQTLIEVGEILLSINIGVGQRAHVELERFIANSRVIIDPDLSLDLGILQRIIPKIRGFKRDLAGGLVELLDALEAKKCVRSARVISRWLDSNVSDDEFLDGTDARIGLIR